MTRGHAPPSANAVPSHHPTTWQDYDALLRRDSLLASIMGWIAPPSGASLHIEPSKLSVKGAPDHPNTQSRMSWRSPSSARPQCQAVAILTG